MINQLLFFTPAGIGWAFKLEEGNLIPDDNDLDSGIFAAIKMFANYDAIWENNIEYISWVHGFTIFSSAERKYTLAISTDKSEDISKIFQLAEKIRERIAEEFFDDISVPDQFFTNGTAVKMKFIPILKEILYNEGYFQDEN